MTGRGSETKLCAGACSVSEETKERGAFVRFECLHEAHFSCASANLFQCSQCFRVQQISAKDVLLTEPKNRAEATRELLVLQAVEAALARSFNLPTPTPWSGTATRAEVTAEVTAASRCRSLAMLAQERAKTIRAAEKAGPATNGVGAGVSAKRVPLGASIIENALHDLGRRSAPIALPDGAATSDSDRAAAAVVEVLQAEQAFSMANASQAPPRAFAKAGRSFAEAVILRHHDPAVFFSDGWSLLECVEGGLLKEVNELRSFPLLGPRDDPFSPSSICAHLAGSVEAIRKRLGEKEAKSIFYDVLEGNVVNLAAARLTAAELRLVVDPRLVASLLRDDINGATLEIFFYLDHNELREWGFTFELIKDSMPKFGADGQPMEVRAPDLSDAEAAARRDGRAEAFVRNRLKWPCGIVDDLVAAESEEKARRSEFSDSDDDDEATEEGGRRPNGFERRIAERARARARVNQQLSPIRREPSSSPPRSRTREKRAKEPYYEDSAVLPSFDEF